MFIRKLSSCKEIVAGDGTALKELLHGPKDGLSMGYSLAHARLAPGETSFLHRLAGSEAYYILSGRGRMEIDGETKEVAAGDVVYIPPKSAQRITNIGTEELAFLCVVDPAWREEDEEVIPLK
jgi:mannose-6-phosphate isomerase-like protein (cupin superfamily)